MSEEPSLSMRFTQEEDTELHDGDVLDTPDGRKEKWRDVSDAATPSRPKRNRTASTKGGLNLTLRDQEKVRRDVNAVPLRPQTCACRSI